MLVGGNVVDGGRVTTIDESEVTRELAAQLDATPFPAENETMVRALTPYVEQYYAGWELADLDPYVVYNSRT